MLSTVTSVKKTPTARMQEKVLREDNLDFPYWFSDSGWFTVKSRMGCASDSIYMGSPHVVNPSSGKTHLYQPNSS